MHPVGSRRGMQDVVMAEDFTFAASSVMGDDVTGLGASRRDIARLRFLALVIGDLPLDCRKFHNASFDSGYYLRVV